MTVFFKGQHVIFIYSDFYPHIAEMCKHNGHSGRIVRSDTEWGSPETYLVDFGAADPRSDLSPGEHGRTQWWCRKESLMPTYAKKYKITVKRKENRNA